MNVFVLHQTQVYDCSVCIGVFETDEDAKRAADSVYRRGLLRSQQHYTVRWSRADVRTAESGRSASSSVELAAAIVWTGTAKGEFGYLIERITVGQILL